MASLTEPAKQNMQEFISRKLKQNNVDTKDPANIFTWMQNNWNDLTNEATIDAFNAAERATEIATNITTAKTYLESQGYTVNGP